jgi:GT2 family glycosyltransferase
VQWYRPVFVGATITMKISIIIPTYNRVEILQETVRRILAQNFSAIDFEVIVIDDGSTDSTFEWLEKKVELCREIVVLRNTSKGRASARNLGLQKARGELFCLLDDDMWTGPEFLNAHWQTHRQSTPQKLAVVGKMVPWPLNEPTIANVAFDQHLSRIMAEVELRHGQLSGNCFYTSNASILRSTLGKGVFFDEEFVGYGLEDTEFGHRLENEGVRFRYEPQALAYHRTRTTIPGNLRRFKEAGRSAVLFISKHPEVAGRLNPPYDVPGVPLHRKQQRLTKRLLNAIFFAAASGLFMEALMWITATIRWRSAAILMMQWAGYSRYGREFRRAALEMDRHRDQEIASSQRLMRKDRTL